MSTTPTPADTEQPGPWIKASKSGTNGGDCIEMRTNGDCCDVRDSKDESSARAVLTFTRSVTAAWIEAAKHGEFDVLHSNPEVHN